MDFVESTFGGEGVEVPLVTSTDIRPGDDNNIWMWYHDQRSPLRYPDAGMNVSSVQGAIATFIQDWLYFGLLAVLCNTAIKVYDLSVPGKHHSRVVSSEQVRTKIISLQLSVLEVPRNERADILQRHERILWRANEAAHLFERQFNVDSSSRDSVDLILLSVKVLIGTISRSYDWLRVENSRLRTTIGSDWFNIAHRQGDQLSPAGRAIEAKMTENGWCLHQIHKVLSTFSYQTAYHFAKLPRPGSARLLHESCSKQSCKGWNSDPGHTSPCHATSTCTCQTISISSVEVANIIQGGHIPLISIEEDVYGNLSLRLHTKRWYSKYVAISHVWADGLGNAFENGLPTCQLRMLQKYFIQIAKDRPTGSILNKRTTNSLFWMDTLCIPVQDAPSGVPIVGDIRRKAIDKMSIVYSSSSHTLVLDAEMRTIPMAANHVTKLAYIQCCGWTTRSWTLQEGCLPPSTVYALSDGIYSHKAARLAMVQCAIPVRWFRHFCGPDPDSVAQQIDSSVQREIWTSVSVRSFSIWDPFKPEQPKFKDLLVRDRFAGVWNELLDRVSSLPADTPAIFANLLGVSAYEVLKRKTEQERVALIIRQQSVLPIELLFNTGPRLRGRLSAHGSEPYAASLMLQRGTAQENDPEDWIGLLDMSELRTRSFQNGWVPASIRGDKCLQPLVAKYYLQVREHCLQVHNNGIEAVPYMHTTEGPLLPMSTFVLDSQCSTIKGHITAHTNRTFITIDKLVDGSPRSIDDQSQERVLGHCFMYDPGLMWAMCRGRIDYAPGCHLLVLSQSDGRITTRYSSPIQLRLCTENTQALESIPTLECRCTCPDCPGIKDYVDILYDADDLGPLLTASLEPPERLSRKYWFNPVAVFASHYSIWAAIAPRIRSSPYTSDIRPELNSVVPASYHQHVHHINSSIRPAFVITAWFIMPLVVYLYQSVILQHVAKRRFLEPLSYQGQPSWPFRFGERNLRHRIDAALVAHWHIMLFGPVLDGLFWIILAGSRGMTFKGTFLSRFQLLLTLLMVAQWYLSLGTEDPNVVLGRDAQRFYILLMVVGFARLVYDACTTGLTWNVFGQYVGLYFQITWGQRIIPFAISMARLTKSEADYYWGEYRTKLQEKWNEIRHQLAQVLHR